VIHLEVQVANAAELLDAAAYGAVAKLRWESGPAVTGPFVEGGTVNLDATKTLYDIWDAAGVVGTWYRTRISNAAASTFSPYSAPFEGGAVTRYAELDDVLPMFDTVPNPRKQARLLRLLDVATSEVTTQMDGRDFFRHPTSGSATWYGSVGRTYRTRGGSDYGILHEHGGIVSLDQLEVSQDLGGSFSVVSTADYVLRGTDPESAEAPPPGEPYFHVVFTGIGTVQGLPRGVNVVRLTGVRGWPAIPVDLVEGTAQRARQLAYADPSYSGSIPGESEYGAGPVSLRWPQTLYNFLQSERERFWCQA
jgi:hypothetical protein